MLTVTTDEIPGQPVKRPIGVVTGAATVSLSEYRAHDDSLNSGLCSAIAAMRKDADSFRADAVINVRAESLRLPNDDIAFYAYGTAITIKD